MRQFYHKQHPENRQKMCAETGFIPGTIA